MSLFSLLHRLAPRTMDGLRDLATAREQHGSVSTALGRVNELTAELERLKSDNLELRADIDELRRNGRRVAELYDLVFERVRHR